MPRSALGYCFRLSLPAVFYAPDRVCAVDENSGAIHGRRLIADARACESAAFEDAAGDAFRCAVGPG